MIIYSLANPLNAVLSCWAMCDNEKYSQRIPVPVSAPRNQGNRRNLRAARGCAGTGDDVLTLRRFHFRAFFV
jgi:hypothetical protein